VAEAKQAAVAVVQTLDPTSKQTAEHTTGQTPRQTPELALEQPDPQALELTPGQPDSQALAAVRFAESFDKACSLLRSNPLYRPILFKILTYCNGTRHLLPELEEHIASFPEFARSTQPPYSLIMWLAEAGAIDMFEIDAAGDVLTDERKVGLSSDEIDDLVENWAFETTEAGRAVIDEFDPQQRINELLAAVPERYETYIEILEFLQEKRPFAEVDALLRGRDILMFGREPGDRPLQPSVFIDKLAACSGIAFNDGWMITEEGKELLDMVRGAGTE
jgi:hypothetical protein